MSAYSMIVSGYLYLDSLPLRFATQTVLDHLCLFVCPSLAQIRFNHAWYKSWNRLFQQWVVMCLSIVALGSHWFRLESTMTELSKSLWNCARVLNSFCIVEATSASDNGVDGKALLIIVVYVPQPDLPNRLDDNDHPPAARLRTLPARE